VVAPTGVRIVVDIADHGDCLFDDTVAINISFISMTTRNFV
jgi:hypothetical protein